MPESRLALSSDQLKQNIGHYLGYGRGVTASETAWTTLQTNDITAVLRSALSQVYNPPLIQGQTHNWSFLRPIATITIAAGQSEADLPDDFGGFMGSLYIADQQTHRPWQIDITTPERVQQQYALFPSTTGAPRLAAEKQGKMGTADGGQRSKLFMWPLTDGAYTFTCQYYYLPDALTGAFPYPPGGALHAELFHASCRAAAERELDGVQGNEFTYFMQRLEAAIAADRKRKGNKLGFNLDWSDDIDRGNRRRWHGYGGTVSINGVDPE